jgi:hypothetical protein
MKKKLIVGLCALIAAAGLAKADVLVGYDGPCNVYWNPYRGYYEVCPSMSVPIYFGFEFNTIHFRNGFRQGPHWRGHRDGWRHHWKGERHHHWKGGH